MKFGIIGTGVIGWYHAEAIRALGGCELHSVFNHTPEKAGRLAAEFGARAHTCLDAFLADPELEIVTVATPSGAHFDPTVAALRAGKHVVCEKPLEVTLDRIDEMIRVAGECGVTLAPILNRRFNPAMEAMKDAVDAGRFGRLTSASCYMKWFRDQAYYDSAEWRGTVAMDGGGCLMNQAIHQIDALLYLAGPVVSVCANTACLAHEGIEVEDIAVAVVEFANGARGVIEGSTCSWSKSGHPGRLQLCGTEGSVFLADETIEVWDFMRENPEDVMVRAELMGGSGPGMGANDPKAMSSSQHQRNFEEVVTAIREGREPRPSARDARVAVEMILAIYESAERGGEKVVLR